MSIVCDHVQCVAVSHIARKNLPSFVLKSAKRKGSTWLCYCLLFLQFVLQCTTLETDIDTKTIQHGGMHTYIVENLKKK